METIGKICEFLDRFAPPELAEDWDNTGLLVGDAGQPVRKVMTCLTVTPQSAAEAVRQRADLVVSHHPLPFHAMKRLTTETVPGRLLLELIRASAAIYSPHTAFDSTAAGINQQLAEGIGLENTCPVIPRAEPGDPSGGTRPAGSSGPPAPLGAGRWGEFPEDVSLRDVAGRLKTLLRVDRLQAVGPVDRSIRRAAVACGSAGEFLGPARSAGCELLVTGETTFHTCLEAEATGVALLLPGHYASERFAVERLAAVLAGTFPGLEVWASRDEADPLDWI